LADLKDAQGIGLGLVEKVLEAIQTSRVTDKELQGRLLADGNLERLLCGELILVGRTLADK
jgi:hypothetical protein